MHRICVGIHMPTKLDLSTTCSVRPASLDNHIMSVFSLMELWNRGHLFMDYSSLVTNHNNDAKCSEYGLQ